MSSAPGISEDKVFCYVGSSRRLSWMYLVCFFLSIATLFVYLPYGLARIRQYIWSHTTIDGVPLEYDGTFQTQLGWRSLASIACVVIFFSTLTLPFATLAALATHRKLKNPSIFFRGPGSFAAPFAIYGGSQYRLHHTSYKSVRFALDGDVVQYTKLYVWRLFLAVVTLGYFYPQFAIATRAYAFKHTRWGGRVVRYAGNIETAAPLYRRGWLLSIVTLGIYAPWWMASLRNYHCNHISIDGAQLCSNQSGEDLMYLGLGNALIQVLTLGAGAGWCTTRSLRYAMKTLTIRGDLSAIPPLQAEQPVQVGLSDLLFVDQWIV